MSLDGITQSFLPYTVDGLQSIDSSFVYYNGVPIGTAFVPYSGASSNVNLNNKNISNVNTLTATTGNITTLNATTSTTSGISTMNQGVIQRNLNVGYVAYVASITVQSSTSMTINLNQAFTASPFPNGTNVILTGFSTYPIFNGSYTVITCTGPSYNILNISSNPSSYITGTFTGPVSITYPYYAQVWCDVDSTGYTTGYSLASQCYFYNTNVINAFTASIGTITTLNTTTGTITTLNSTTGTILTMNSNTATIGSFGLVALISILGGTPSQPLISLSLSVTPLGFVAGASVTFVGVTGTASIMNGVFTINSISSPGNFFLSSNPGLAVGYYSPGSSAYVYLTGTGSFSSVNGTFVGGLTAPTMVSTDNSTNVATTAYVTTAIAAIPTGYITSTGTTSGVNATLQLTASGIFSVQSSLGIPYFTINGAVANPYVATYGLSSATYLACTSTSFAVPSVGVNGGTGDRLIIYQGTSATYPASMGMQASNVMWFSSPLQYYWYCNGTTMMTLSSTSLVVNSTAVNINSLNVVGSTGKMAMSNTGVGAPAVFGGGSGDRIQLFPGGGTTYPYALGINSSTLWYSVPSGAQHSWYIGGTNYMNVSSTVFQTLGLLSVTDGLTSISAGVGTAAYVNSTLSVLGSTTFDGTNSVNFQCQASQYGRNILYMTGRYESSNDSWTFSSPRNGIIFRTQSALASAYTQRFTIQNYNNQLGILSAGQSNSPIMCFNDNGNIGIGTSAPAYLLDISGGTTGNINFTNTNGTGVCYLRLQSQYSACYLSVGAVLGVNSYIGLQSGANTSSAITTPCLVVTNNNTVGINNANPGSTLDVNGSLHVQGSMYMNGLVNQNANYGYIISAANGSNFMVSQLATTTYTYNGSWIGGLSIGSFNKGSINSTINITGLASWYYTAGSNATLTMRLYGTGAGNYVYRTQNYFTNNTGNHVTFPINFQYDVGANLAGNIYIYMYCIGSIAADVNDYVNLTVTILPN